MLFNPLSRSHVITYSFFMDDVSKIDLEFYDSRDVFVDQSLIIGNQLFDVGYGATFRVKVELAARQ